jgi:hypothetical protein
VSVVTVCSGVFDVRSVDRDTTGLFFGSVVDFVETLGGGEAAGSEGRADCGGQGGFTVVNVADGANVAVRLASVKMFFCHFIPLLQQKVYRFKSRSLKDFR